MAERLDDNSSKSSKSSHRDRDESEETSELEIEKAQDDDRMKAEKKTVEMSVEEWLAVRKEAACEIDPETAEVEWWYAQTLDPYGVYP